MGHTIPLYILCGGHSRRMGMDKAQLLFNGKTFLEQILKKADPLFKEIILLGADRPIPGNFPQIPDAIEDAGPLGGLLAAIQHSKTEAIAIVPVDLPLIADATLRVLVSAEQANKKVLVAKASDRIQPLVGVYQTILAPALYDYLASGRRAVMGFLDLIEYDTFEVTDDEIQNINTPEQYNLLLKKET